MSKYQRLWWFGSVFGWLFVTTALAQELPRGFTLRVFSLRGRAEAQLPDETKQGLKVNDEVALGGIVRTEPKSSAVLVWLPYKARVKLDFNSQVQLMLNRVLSLKHGRIWLGTPPPPMGERRYPLPVQAGHVQIVSSPDAIFSAAIQPNGTVLVSVDYGVVLVTAQGRTILVTKGLMVLIPPLSTPLSPTPMSPQERLLWDMGGPK